jgi:hypothetical protein
VTRAYEVAHVDELDRVPAEDFEWRPVRRRFGIESFGTNAYAADAGRRLIEEHEEGSGHQELYVILTGRARFVLDGEELDAPAGTVVFIPEPTVKREAFAEEDGTTGLAVGGWAGKPFEPSAWEWFFQAYAQPIDEGVATIQDGLERFAGREPQESALLYHLACIEALAGRENDARRHLDEAIERRPSLRERANNDPDVASLVS